MNFDFEQINWIAIGVCFVIGQVYLTIWFTALFGEPWARAYAPGKTKAEHTKEIPGWTYAIGAVAMILLVIGLALLQNGLGVSGVGGGLGLALFVSLTLVLTTMVPGYAFLKRWNALVLAAGSQVTLIFILSVVLAVWK